MTKAVIALLVCLYGMVAPAYSQSQTGTYHVFPLVVDGHFPDGTFYRSTLFAVNANSANTTCTYRSYGISEDRLQLSNVFTIPGNGGVSRTSSTGNLAFASGYGTLGCDKDVQAFMQYEYVSAASEVLGIATVFSAPAATTAEFIFPVAAGYRMGLALANDSDSAAFFDIRVGALNKNELQTRVQIPAHTTISQFVDEFITMPPGFVPVAALVESVLFSNGGVTPKFHATGLVLWQSSFSTVPPVVFSP